MKAAKKKKRLTLLDVLAVCSILLCVALLYGMLRSEMWSGDRTEMAEDGYDQETITVSQPHEAPVDSVDETETGEASALEDSEQDAAFLVEAEIEQLRRSEVGDTILFGTFEQDMEDEEPEPIQWIVLAKEEDRLLVISSFCLDWRPYHLVRVPVTWEECTLRKWLNEDFFAAAFSEGEQTRISTVTNDPGKHPDYNTDPGSATEDRVFLLSAQELRQYSIPKGEFTAWAAAGGADAENCPWWLRSPGLSQNNAARATYDGGIILTDDHVNKRCGVRPALWIHLGE